MTPNTATNAPVITTAVTSVGGFLTLVSQYSTEITVLAVVASAVASIVFGVWARLNESRRNEINEIAMTHKIIRKMQKDGLIDSTTAGAIRDELNIY